MSDNELQSYDTFLVRQLIRPMVNVYTVTVGGDPKAPGPVVAFVKQKRMAFKEQIRVFADEQASRELFNIKARRVIEIGGQYDVIGADGQAIGVLQKKFKQSLVRSTWNVLDAMDSDVMLAQEKSAAIAVLRRVKEVFPYTDMIPLPYHFSFLRNEREIGSLSRVMSFRDQYVLDLSGDVDGAVDRRLAIALAIALDALQGR
ncbi:MAG TPA: hypothetical protein VNP73_06095 [Actinomycetota bacterium]|nr:hypothetical protein [Actinomycetota bacterium]